MNEIGFYSISRTTRQNYGGKSPGVVYKCKGSSTIPYIGDWPTARRHGFALVQTLNLLLCAQGYDNIRQETT